MQLDDAYANAPYIPQAETYPDKWAREAADFRTRLKDRAELSVSYGDTPRQMYDFFRCDGPAKGTMVFVHGGYWLKFDRTQWSHLAEGALSRGWNVAVVQYDLCPQVAIADITNQIAAAVSKISKVQSGPVSLTGHSAGGHLVARMLAPGVLSSGVLERIVSVAPISPVADLRPLLDTSMNADFKLDMDAACAESPVLQPPPDIPVKVWVGAGERPAFLEQAGALAHAWQVPQKTVNQKHHFDIIELLQDSDSSLVRFLTPNTA